MNDLILMYTITLSFVCVIVGLLLVYRYFLGNRLVAQTQKLRAEINRVPKDILEYARNPSANVTKGLEDIGIEGIMNELGIDPGILKNPLVKGLVEKYAPRVIESLSKGAKGGNKSQGEEINLL